MTPSDAQQLTVQAVRATDLPQAVINGVVDKGTLDLTAFNGDGLLALSPWRLSAAGQKVWITARAEGVGQSTVLVAYPISGVEATSGLKNVAVSRAWLQGVRNGSSIVIECRVTFDGSDDVSTSVVFPVTTYTVKQRVGIIDRVAVGQGPHSINITNDGLRAFVANRDSNSVSVIDIKARKVIRTITGISTAFRSVLSPDNSLLYVSNLRSRSFTIIDTSTYSVVNTVQIDGGDDVIGLAVTADGLRLFVACHKNKIVSVHNAKTGQKMGSSITVTRDPYDLTINPEQTQVFIASYLEIGIINANGNGGLVGRISGTGRTQEIVFNPGNSPSARGYVTEVDNVLVINPVTNAIIKRIPGVRYAWGAAINPRAKQLWVGSVGPGGTQAYRDSVFIIDTVTDEISTRLTGFDNVADIAFVPSEDLALAVNQATGIVYFIAT